MKLDVEERLKYVELCLLLLGEFKKAYFYLLFDTQEAQHTKDMKAYKTVCQENISYHKSLKRFLPTPEFKPKFLPEDSQALLAYQKYVTDRINSKVEVTGDESPFHQPRYLSQPFLQSPDMDLWCKINIAITKKQVLKTVNISLRKKSAVDNKSYSIQPLALVHNGFRWHVRSYVQETNEFRDFVLSRMSELNTSEEQYNDIGSLANDDSWNNIVTLLFKPHPKLNEDQAKTVELDYGMEGGIKEIPCRECEIQHILKLTRTGLDDVQQEPHLFPIVLDNKNELMPHLEKLKTKGYI
jgi:hypothetical protein